MIKTLLLTMVVLLVGSVGAAAQSATPTLIPFTPPPSPTWLPTQTAFPSPGFSTNTPDATVQNAWPTPTRPVFGTPYQIPQLPNLTSPDLNQAEGFDSIGQNNTSTLAAYIVTVIVSFYGWLAVNYQGILRGLRIFSLIMATILSIRWFWKGSKYESGTQGQLTIDSDDAINTMTRRASQRRNKR